VRDDCLQEVSTMLGRQLMASQGTKIEERVRNAMRMLARQNPEEWRAKSYTTQLHEAAAQAAQDMKEEFAQKRRNVELTIAAHDRIENFLMAQPNKKAGDGLRAVSKLADFDTRGGGYTSVQSWSTSIRETAFGELRKTWEAIPGNFFGLFEDKKGVADLWKELHGEDSGNGTAKAGADAWKKITEEMRSRFNDAGGHVGKLEDWSLPQHHSQTRVANAGKTPSESLEKWTADILPKLDRSKYVNADGSRMSNDQMHQFLAHAFDSIITDGHNGTEAGSVSGEGVIANRNAAHRQIFFKDADAHAEYNASYGETSMNNLLAGHIARMSRDIALTERLGPNSAATFKHFNDRAMQDEVRQDPTKLAKLEKQQTFNERLFDAVSGKDKVVDQRVANAFQAFRNWMTATKLGKVVITALSDEAGMMSTAVANHVPYGQALLEELKRVPNGQSRKFAEHTGLGIDAFMSHMNRFAQEEFGSSFSGKMASSVMRLSGAERMWAARRQGMGTVLMSSIGKLTRSIEHVDGLSVADHGVLAKKGVTDTQWQVWRRAEPENWGGTSNVLTPKSIWAIPDEKLKDLGDPTALKRDAATQLMAHVHEEAGMGAMDTGPRQRIAVNLGTQRGSYGGEIWRSMNLFRGFAFSMMMKHWARAADMPGTGKIKYLAPLFVYGTAMAALGNQIRNLLAGQDPDKMFGKDTSAFWGRAILRGGGFGFFGDFLQNETSQHDTTLAAALGGPAATTAEDILSLTHGAYFKSKHGDLGKDEKAGLIRFAKGNIPLLNMWYTQAAMDHLLWNHLQEAASPGYLARMQAKQEANFGKTYFWRPDEATPHSGPDFAKALGGNKNANFAGNSP
jgi:hypothetical protein